jgi:hypothetical protein
VQPLPKEEWRSLKKLIIELSSDSVIPFLGIYLKVYIPGYYKDICIPMFVTALFTITKLLKQPRCPMADEYIKKI